MKMIYDYELFESMTVPVLNLERELLDLRSDCVDGLFWPKRLEELKEFCKENPEYHIMSIDHIRRGKK